MSADRVAADVADLLGPGGVLVSFLGQPVDLDARRARLREATRPGGVLVVVDHNQPRRWLPRLLSGALLSLQGLSPARARHATARELLGLGFEVECLRLGRGERVQFIRAKCPDLP